MSRPLDSVTRLVVLSVVIVLVRSQGQTALPGDLPTSVGTNFVFSFPSYMYENVEPYILVTAQSTLETAITVSVPGIAFTKRSNVSCDQTVVIFLPSEVAVRHIHGFQIQSSTVITIEATLPVSVHGLCKTVTKMDGFVVLPTTVLGRVYMPVSFHSQSRGDPTRFCTLAVAALYNNTNIKLSVSGSTQLNIELQEYESYHYWNTELMGMIISSNKMVSVVTSCIARVFYLANQFDLLIENLPPVATLGQHYILAPFLGRRSGYVFRVLAIAEKTQVTISDKGTSQFANTIPLQPGVFYEGDTNKIIGITADNPVIVTQYAKSAYTDNSGDPFMIVMPSTEFYSGNVSFPVANITALNVTIPTRYYVSITTACLNADNIYLDDILLISNRILQTADAEFCVLRSPVNAGLHSVTHSWINASFLVIVYGFTLGPRDALGYGYVAAYDIDRRLHEDEIDGCQRIHTPHDVTMYPDAEFYSIDDNVTLVCSNDGLRIKDENNTLICVGDDTWVGEIPTCSSDKYVSTFGVKQTIPTAATLGGILIIVAIIVRFRFKRKLQPVGDGHKADNIVLPIHDIQQANIDGLSIKGIDNKGHDMTL